uniref:Ubiquitin carboxyl-terminal hydrolase n=2 Tax=Cyprinus carpio TaxID=7962 RepID=A0A9J8CUV0_CYPCA
MRLKDPFSLKTADMTKRSNKPKKPRDEDSSDEVCGLTCQHVSRAVDLSSVKKAVTGSLWSVCSDCLKERNIHEGEPAGAHDILVCLKCGFQGCNQAETQHSTKHQQAHHSDSHCITISLSTWKAWCFECKEELSTHCNKKALAQTLDFLQKHSAKATSGTTSKIIRLLEESAEYVDTQRGRTPVNSTLIPVKGINNLGNTCFFNAVMQNLSQTHMLNDLIQDVKEKGHKMKICPPAETKLGPLTVTLPSPEPLTSAMFLFLQSIKEPGKGPVSPKILFNQLCQKAPRFKGYQQQDSQELLHYLLDSMRVEETKRIKAGILKAFNNPTEKTADEETKRQVKAYGKEGVKMNFVDRIFVGELTSTIMCEECEHISTVKEAFIDISLPIIEERVRPTIVKHVFLILFAFNNLSIHNVLNCLELSDKRRALGRYIYVCICVYVSKVMLYASLCGSTLIELSLSLQAGMNLRKVNRHVDFPLLLDLAPFCSATCKNLGSGERVLYSLYGIVEHSGSMRGGHYAAYVKVRPPQRKPEQRKSANATEASSVPQGQWVYVSDTNVQTVPESRVLNSQAYLLFYEELL